MKHSITHGENVQKLGKLEQSTSNKLTQTSICPKITKIISSGHGDTNQTIVVNVEKQDIATQYVMDKNTVDTATLMHTVQT